MMFNRDMILVFFKGEEMSGPQEASHTRLRPSSLAL